VLASRLSDARFFFAEDKKHSMDDWNKTLDSVVFQAKFPEGARTIGDKVGRIVEIVESIPASPAAGQAARYCKADLASKAVGEFPELQGTMGKHYARHHQLGQEVADAIEQHWWPKGQGGALPTTREAALVALADKLDTVVGCFAVKLEPSGSADPFGLRRAAIGIWQIVLSQGDDELFYRTLAATIGVLDRHGFKVEDQSRIDEFFKQRLHGILVENGIPTQDVAGALAQNFKMPADARARAEACAKISKEAREVFKRVANILDDAKAKGIALTPNVDPKLFVSDVERNLLDAILKAQESEREARSTRNYAAVFESLERLRPTVAAFFDKGGVMVMDPDPKLRDNRLALLNWFIAPYLAIADFRLLGGAQ
jgi:glycyl-tRNA synthetase beta chain